MKVQIDSQEIDKRVTIRVMNSAVAGAIVFACLFGAGLLGMRVRAALPEHHLTADTRTLSGSGWD
jgi:hypothetical protein